MEIFLNKRNNQNFSGFHPWVLEHSIIEPTARPKSGQIVDLLNTNGSWIGRGVYNSSSRIRVRLYQWHKEAALDQNWLQGKIDQAIELRRTWINRNRLDAVRWINSEGDGLSGLIVDQFGEYLVVHLTSLAMKNWQAWVVEHLVSRLSPQGIMLKIDETTAQAEGIEPCDEVAYGQRPDNKVVVHEGPVKILVDLAQGQKTGYYLDQRQNRQLAALWIETGGRLLDVCCYLGGFSLAAHAIARPSKILAIDSSAKVLEQAQLNATLNGAEIEFVQADCFDYLANLQKAGEVFSSIVLDPPKMAGNRNQIQSALRAYHRLNLSAVHLLKPGGTLITCSCSGRIDRDDFRGMLASVAQRSRRTIQIIQALGADFDHPVMAHCPETEYLKCFICRVE